MLPCNQAKTFSGGFTHHNILFKPHLNEIPEFFQKGASFDLGLIWEILGKNTIEALGTEKTFLDRSV